MLDIIYSPEREEVRAEISGELDHCSAAKLRTAIDLEVMKRVPRVLTIDLARLGFMDSSGIGLIIGRYKLVSELGGKVVVEGASPSVAKLLRLAGISRICTVRSFEGGLKV
ncbi:MAG: anti-sigma factor antagonist [Ruminococcus sp.]|nr:anti-sigma factor antagonist [Ruminococcus sp.]